MYAREEGGVGVYMKQQNYKKIITIAIPQTIAMKTNPYTVTAQKFEYKCEM